MEFVPIEPPLLSGCSHGLSEHEPAEAARAPGEHLKIEARTRGLTIPPRRRAVLAAISVGTLTVLSAGANAQQHDPIRRIEVLMGGLSEGDPAGLAEIA